jgi:hypothetical protein
MGLEIYHVTPYHKTKDSLEYFTLDEFQNNLTFLEKHKHLITQNELGSKVLYYKIKGFHRKRVTHNFIVEFANEELYFNLRDVKKAKLYIRANPGENQEDLENDFQKNFIDNFIEGESVLFISY